MIVDVGIKQVWKTGAKSTSTNNNNTQEKQEHFVWYTWMDFYDLNPIYGLVQDCSNSSVLAMELL